MGVFLAIIFFAAVFACGGEGSVSDAERDYSVEFRKDKQ